MYMRLSFISEEVGDFERAKCDWRVKSSGEKC